MAFEPSDVTADVAGRAHDAGRLDPPRMLRHPPGKGAPLPPLRPGEEITAVHRDWERRHDTPPAGQTGAGGIMGAARSRLANEVLRAAGPALEADLALIGDLIRAVDALAARVDVLSDRVMALEELVEDVVITTSEDMAKVRAALGRSPSGGG